MYITTNMSLSDYETCRDQIEAQLAEANIDIDLSVHTVCRTWARDHFTEWFANFGWNWQLFYNGPDNYGGGSWSPVDTDIDLCWEFPVGEHKQIAMLFKLAFGG
jgi:hypothetical protein